MKKYSLIVWIALAISFIGTALAGAGGKASWSSAQPISPALQPDPTRGSQLNDVATNASGLAIAVWDQFSYTSAPTTIGAAVQSGGRWGAPFSISGNATGFAMSPKAAAGADGTLAASWIYQDGSSNEMVQAAVRAAGSTTWKVSTLAVRPTRGSVEVAPIGVDSSGNVTVVWSASVNGSYVIQGATTMGGVWQAPLTISGATTGTLYPALSVNASGAAGVVYSVWPPNLSTYAEYVFRSSANGTWTAPRQVSETMSATVGYVQNLLVALDAGGLATVAYTGNGLEAVRQLSSTSWTVPGPVIHPPNTIPAYLSPDLAVDRNGNSVLAVSVFDSTINVDRASVWVSTATPDGKWTPQLRLTDPAVPVDAYATRVAVSPDGNLTMVGWIDHYHGTVQVSALVSRVWSTAKTIGRGTAYSSFQEVLGLDFGSSAFGCAIWKSSKGGTQIMAATYR